MVEENTLCERKEQTILTDLFEQVNDLLKDSDDVDEKAQIKTALQNMAAPISYIILGDEGVGKTSLLQTIFQDILDVPDYMDADICEYRWGEQKFSAAIQDGYVRSFQPTDNLRGLSVIDTKGLRRMPQSSLEKIGELARSCEVVMAAFEAENIKCPKLWDVLDNIPSKRIIFLMTKCDLISEKELETNIEKLKSYMRESKISAPIFAVSTLKKTESSYIISPDILRSYIREELVGQHPLLAKQVQNVENTRKLLVQLHDSFALRKRQYESDAAILQKINQSMDAYVMSHKEVIDGFTRKLAAEIESDIDEYEKEIISKMDPYKIKERFKTQEDFEFYLNMVNDNYKTMMNDSINRKTMETIKSCMHDLEIIFQEATGYFNKRENILDLNDRFYGTLSTSRKQMVTQTKETVVAAEQFYNTLSSASETLFMQIWEERKKYDQSIAVRRKLAASGGALAGAGTSLAAMKALEIGFFAVAKAGLAGVVTAAAAPVLGAALVGIGVIVGAVTINAIAKKMYDPQAAKKMEENTKDCIRQFKEQVANTRKAMTEQITIQIVELFENEVKAIDSCFTEFRMSVNIDERRLPILEEKMLRTEKLLEQLGTI